MSLVSSSTDFLKLRLAIDNDETSFFIGWLNNFAESFDSTTSMSGIIS